LIYLLQQLMALYQAINMLNTQQRALWPSLPEVGLLPFVVSLKNTLEQEGLSGARLDIEVNNLADGFHQALLAE